jgi:hypothetical protein
LKLNSPRPEFDGALYQPPNLLLSSKWQMSSPQEYNTMQIGKYALPNEQFTDDSTNYAQSLSGAFSHNLQSERYPMADKPKKLPDQIHGKLRLKNYSYATEQTFIG